MIKPVYLIGSFVVLLAFAELSAHAELVHFYSFDSQTARDAVGENDGTVNGNPDFVDGASGQPSDRAINLNEEGGGFNDDFVSFEPTSFGDAFSIAAWIRPSDIDQSNQMMAIAANTHGGFAGPDGFKWTVNQWDSRDQSLRLETGDTVTGTNQGVEEIIFYDEWQHVAITFDKDVQQFQMFHDGLRLVSGGILDFGDDHPWQIGAFRAPEGGLTNAGFIGAIDNVAVFDHVLSDDEVFEIFEMGIDVPAGVVGDFNGDGLLTDVDIDLLSDQVLAGGTDLSFDLDGDGAVNGADRTVWVDDLKKTYFGDSNLDGVFTTSDFVFVFQRGQYEDAIAANSTWATGDWNGDKEFSSSDFVTAFQAGGYEQPPRAALGVPEPYGALTLMIGCAVLPLIRRQRR